jgi:hypothetical protein
MGDGGTVSNESEGYDPFAVFQAMADEPSRRALYGAFANLRAKASVHEGSTWTVAKQTGRPATSHST